MITAMKKYAFLVFHRDYQDFLEKLGKLGVLHVIENTEKEKQESLAEKEKTLERVENILEFLKKNEKVDVEGRQALDKGADLEEMLQKVEELKDKISEKETRLEELTKEIERVTPWGDYDQSDLQKFIEAGYRPRMYKISTRQFDPSWEEMDNLFVINEEGGQVYFIVLEGEGESIEIDAELEKPVERSLSELYKDKEQTEKELEEDREKLAIFANNLPPLINEDKKRLESEVSLLQVYQDTRKESEDTLMILEGWVPEDKEEEVAELVEKEDVVSIATVPDKDEEPPVELKNTKFAKLFEPISKLFDLPSYREMDLTPYFAPFFMLFFGFCLGDAGYGVFFILFAGILKLKANKEFKPILSLTQYLGAATILFGLLSGTFFGMNLIDSGYTFTENSVQQLEESEVPATVFSKLESIQGEYYESRSDFLGAVEAEIGTEATTEYRQEVLKSALPGIPIVGKFRHLMQDPLNMFYLSLILGGMQIVFGIFVKILNITRRQGFRYALAPLGWLILVISLILYGLGSFEGKVLNYLFYGMLGIAGIFIFFLNNPDINIFARFGSGIWESYNTITGIFGDLLSYIRLFALGISSAILGFVFNDISLQLLNIPYLGWLLFLVLLLAGHSINLFLASLGGFIHPMRLTFVEFYKNAGFEGGGKKYKPFNINN